MHTGEEGYKGRRGHVAQRMPFGLDLVGEIVLMFGGVDEESDRFASCDDPRNDCFLHVRVSGVGPKVQTYLQDTRIIGSAKHDSYSSLPITPDADGSVCGCGEPDHCPRFFACPQRVKGNLRRPLHIESCLLLKQNRGGMLDIEGIWSTSNRKESRLFGETVKLAQRYSNSVPADC